MAAAAAEAAFNPLLDGIISARDLEAKRRSPLPMPDALLVLDALQPHGRPGTATTARPRLHRRAAVLIFAALKHRFGVPLEVVNAILAFSIDRQCVFSPYVAPTSSKKYSTVAELQAIRFHGVSGIEEWNACFTGVCPYPLENGDFFTLTDAVAHKNSIGIVSQRFDGGASNLRFCPEAVVFYTGIALLHARDPEFEIKPRENPGWCARLSLSVHVWRAASPHVDERRPRTRRYAALWTEEPGQATARPFYTFWLPDHVFGLRPDTGEVERCFAAVQVWNQGRGVVAPEIGRVALPPPPPHPLCSFYDADPAAPGGRDHNDDTARVLGAAGASPPDSNSDGDDADLCAPKHIRQVRNTRPE